VHSVLFVVLLHHHRFVVVGFGRCVHTWMKVQGHRFLTSSVSSASLQHVVIIATVQYAFNCPSTSSQIRGCRCRRCVHTWMKVQGHRLLTYSVSSASFQHVVSVQCAFPCPAPSSQIRGCRFRTVRPYLDEGSRAQVSRNHIVIIIHHH
jgi:hypothetical protein